MSFLKSVLAIVVLVAFTLLVAYIVPVYVHTLVALAKAGWNVGS
jgi:hypothetical protein